MISEDDRELIHQLLEDIRTLEDQFSITTPKPSVARAVLAPILRRWIAEGLFHAVQKILLPTHINFDTTSNTHSIKLCKAGVLEHWLGMIIFGTVGVSTSQAHKKYILPNGQHTVSLNDPQNGQKIPQRGKDFFNQRMLFWKDQFYTRSDIIKIQANTLGGVHFDFNKMKKEPKIGEIKNYLGYEVIENNIQMLIGDDVARGRADKMRRENIYDSTELITIDTAKIFADGVSRSTAEISALL